MTERAGEGSGAEVSDARGQVMGGAGKASRRQAVREAAARTYAGALPVVPVRARGLTVEGADGRRYLDCLSGAGTLALGHNHPVVLEAIREVLDSGAPLHTLGPATPVEDAFVTELLRTLPPGLAAHARVRFCGPGGTDAIGAAADLARTATGRTGLFSAGTGGPRGAELPFPRPESVLGDPGSGVPRPAGVLLDAVQRESVVPVPDDWLRRMRKLTADRSIPLIVDETETGVGRTGAFWAVGHSGITPDVMVLAKAIGGSLPLAVVVHHKDLDPGELGIRAGMFRGNQLAMAAGAATLAHVREHRLADHAATLGARMLSRLRDLAAEFPHLGEVRGRGLMIGLEVVGPEGGSGGVGRSGGGRESAVQSGVPGGADLRAARQRSGRRFAPEGLRSDANSSPGHRSSCPTAPVSEGPSSYAAANSGPRTPHPFAAALRRACLDRGLIVGLGGPRHDVVRLLPPLTISEDQAAAVLDRFADAVEAVSRDPRRPRSPRQRTRPPGRRRAPDD